MPEFLKLISLGWRTPKRKWEDLWRLRRGDLNHVLGMRQFGGPKYQRGSVSVHPQAAAAQQGLPAGGTMPNLQAFSDNHSNSAPTITRSTIAWDSDGSIEVDLNAQGSASIIYAELTTQSDDANDHTNDWWPDQPDVNEGLNWDIRYTNEASGGVVTARHFLETTVPADRVEDTWYLLDTVSNDHGDAVQTGAICVNRNNGTVKSPSTGAGDITCDIEIRVTTSGSAVASQSIFLEVEGT